MTTTEGHSPCEIYRFHLLLLHSSPTIWRRVHIRNDSSIADLHHVLQIVMSWDDTHLHRFTLHGKEYGVAVAGERIIFHCSAVGAAPSNVRQRRTSACMSWSASLCRIRFAGSG